MGLTGYYRHFIVRYAEIAAPLTDMTAVGSGVIDWKRILGQSEKAGIKHYFVEHDKAEAPFESIKMSYDYLSKLRF